MAHRILTIDDDPGTTHGLKRLLGRTGYEVREENDSTHALAAAREFQPHVVILDYGMPKFHGGDVAWQLASDPQLRSTKVILCSGYDPEEFIHKLPPAAIPIVEKPVETGRLLVLIEQSVCGDPEHAGC
jgi:CheY-like chemotaxis protein